ncbi:MAG: tannase/feruloyl esterase family alpha/beta hydrolase, partial [Leptothrix sp. (in: b-proteobacteria)]
MSSRDHQMPPLLNTALHPRAMAVACLALMQAACGGGSDSTSALPQLAAASNATLLSCTDLAAKITFANTRITAANAIADGVLTVAGTPVAAHCQITGVMNERVSLVDGKSYAIGFEMRLPQAWNGRFFYQANGGIDGSVLTATGGVNGGGALTNALKLGFAVISSDAGHSGGTPFFGLDPQARLDYGYQAVGTLTPMAKAAIKVAYGKAPDRSYIGGCSNGGRHTMVAAARYADQYDGFLVGDPGFRLPLAATANIAAYQAYATVATDPANPATGYTPAEQALVASAVLAKCDALDGAADGLVQDTAACQAAFNLDRDVPTCTSTRDGTCLTAAQKAVIGKRFAGVTNSAGSKFYASFPFDAGIGSGNTAFWNFFAPPNLDSGAVGFIWQVPPAAQASFNGATFALTGSIDTMLANIQATSATYAESSLSFMTPPNPSNLATLKNRGAKMMVYHGTSDPIFSSDDTTAWYESLRSANAGDASNFSRFYRVPGMTHCSGGPTTDQFDMLTPLVNWVEQG